MLKNYFLTALRSFSRSRLNSIISLFGIALGIGSALLILLFVRSELRYDRHFKNADRVVRLVRERSALSAGPMAPALDSDLAGIESSARLDFDDGILVSSGGDEVFEERLFFADSSFLNIFDLTFLRGDARTALRDPDSIVLSRSAARKLFGDSDPVGRAVTIEGDDGVDLSVSAVVEDIEPESHFHFDYLASFELVSSRSNRMENWTTNWLYTYALLSPGTHVRDLNTALPSFFKRHAGEAWDHFHFERLTDIHLKSGLGFDIEPQGSMSAVYVFIAIAILVLVIAAVNFTNLATARSARRAREIGMRKALGADRARLVRQFLGESIAQGVLAGIFALGFAALMLGFVNDLSGKSLSPTDLLRPDVQVILWTTALLVGIAAGIYPALVLARFRPDRTLRGGTMSAGGARVRQSLVVLQFVASAFLLSATFVVHKQLDYLQGRSPGFDRDLTVVLSLEGIDLETRGDFIRSELESGGPIADVTLTGNLPGDEVSDFLYRPEAWPDPDDLPGFDTYFVDEDFTEVMGIEMVEGRPLSRDKQTDANRFLINESAARVLTADGGDAWSNPVGKTLEFMVPGAEGWYTLKTGIVTGVVKDFNYRSFRESIDPLILQPFPEAYDMALVHVRAGELTPALDFLEKKYAEFGSPRPYSFYFLDSYLNDLYGNEQRIGELLAAFSLLAVVIACLGILGLATLSVQRRQKEMGIRKVLGARGLGLMGVFVREYVILVLVATVIAAVPAYLAVSQWLDNFAYRTGGIGLSIAKSAVLLMITAIVTVGFQAYRASAVNPAKSLRSE